MKDKTTYGLSPERVAQLLAIGLQSRGRQNDACARRTPAELLQNMLASELPLDSATPDSLPVILNRPCDELLPAAGHTMSDLLTDSKTDMAIVEALKDYGKELVRRRGPKARQAAATAIYYAAIASALVFHRHKITRYSYRKLDEAYAKLEQKLWVPSELRDLFRRVRDVCRQGKPEPE